MESAVARIQRLTADLNTLAASKRACAPVAASGAAVDVVITLNEINDRHGTGALLKRLLRGRRNIFSIRFHDDWGQQDLGDWDVRLPQSSLNSNSPDVNRAETYRNVLRALSGFEVRSALAVPYCADDFLAAIAVQDSFGVHLCGYIMDDQNVAVDRVPDAVVLEFLERCSLRLATHPELRAAYEQKFGLPFFLLPAIVPAVTPRETPGPVRENRGAILGSFWSQSWFNRLCDALEGSGYEMDWFGNCRSPWVEFSAANLERARIRPLGIIDENRLAIELQRYPFVIVPTGSLEEGEGEQWLARLSLPGRIIFAAAAAQTPVIVVGSERTCASRFVRNFAIGETVGYNRAALQSAMERMRNAEMQREMRARAARMAPAFSDHGVGEWLDRSIELGRAADSRFEDIFEGYCIET